MTSIERRVEELERRQRSQEGWTVVSAHDPPRPEELRQIEEAERRGQVIVVLRYDDIEGADPAERMHP
jgi:hypothetical protein